MSNRVNRRQKGLPYKLCFTKWRALFLFAAFFLVTTPLKSQQFEIVQRGADFYRIRFRLKAVQLQPAAEYFGRAAIPLKQQSLVPVIPGAALLPDEDGFLLPQVGYSLALGETAAPAVKLLQATVDTLQNVALAAVADTLIPPRDQNRGQQLDPARVPRIGGVPLHSFQFRPVRYDRDSRRLLIVREAEFEVRFRAGARPELPLRLKKRVPRSIAAGILNWQDIRWTAAEPKRKVSVAGKMDWLEPNRTYVKLLVHQDGLYRVSGRDLAELGVDPAAVAPSGLQLYYKGKPYPIYLSADGDSAFEPDEFFEFYGFRNPGERQYYNDYSDTSVFWLTWGEGGGLRVAERPVNFRGGQLVSVFYETEHREEDKIYHSGDYALAVFNTDHSPGEGWIWMRIYAGDEPTFDVTAYNYPQNPVHPDSLVIKLHGITNDPVNPDHHLRVELNGTVIGDIRFDGVRDVVSRFEIPAGTVKLGKNELKLRSLGDTGAKYDAVYLDWFELKHDRQLIANDDQLFFSAPKEADRQLAQYYVTNFRQNDVVLYDVSHLVRLTGLEVSPSGARYFAFFSDSVRAGTRYLIAASDAIRPPDRIVLDRPSSLRDPSNRADYLIITHRRLWQQAQELAEYRKQHSGVQPFVADVEDILDEFNYGLMDPLAIRDFIAFAAKNWQPPAPRYVVLFGDASWDFKKNGENSVKENLVPTYGNPVSDSRLVSIDGLGDFLPDLFVGRLPAESRQEAEEMVRKIQEYESQPHQPWQKNVIFLNGGFNDWEQNLFRSQSEEIIQNYIEAPPFGGNPVRIYKESDGLLVGEHRSDILNALDNGALWLSFLGHAGSETWDLMLNNEDIPELNNGDRLPFISSMTCHTARFANPVLTTFGELFLKVQGRGAVAFWGTTGWGYIFQDRVLLTELFRLVMQDSVWTLGEATTATKLHLWNLLGYSQINVSTIDQYTLLGDPLTRLAVPPKPDLAVSPGDIRVTPEEPSQSDSTLQVVLTFFNYGLVPQDSVELQVSLLSAENGAEFASRRFVLPPPLFSTSLSAALPLKGAKGELSLQVRLDPQEEIEELDETNNLAEKSVYVYSTSIELSKPLPGMVLKTGRPVLQVYSPERLSSPPAIYWFEVDTSQAFSSAFLLRSDGVPETAVVTKWQVGVPLQPGHYFWRCRTQNGDQYSKWLVSDFWIAGGQDSAAWREDATNALHNGTVEHLALRDGAAVLAYDPDRLIYLEVLSAGYNDGSDCKLVVNYQVLNQTGRGHHLVALDPKTGSVLDSPRHYDTYADSTAANAMADYILSFPDSTIFLVGIMDEGSAAMTGRAYQALELLGSLYCRNVGFRDSWALIGRKGAAPGSVPESWVPRGGGAATVRDTLKLYRYTSGRVVSREVGPAARWDWLRWGVQTPGSSSGFEMRVLGKRAGTGQWQILRSATGGNILPLGDVDVAQYPTLKWELTLTSADGLDSPAFEGWLAGLVPAPDLATHPSLFEVVNDSLLEGKTLHLKARVANVGMSPSDSGTALLEVERESEVWDSVSVARFGPLAPDETAQLSFAAQTAGLRGVHRFRITLDPEGRIVEISERNNQYTGKFFVQKDTLRPRVEITFDDRTILPGDLVRAEPVIRIIVRDNSPLAIADTSLVRLFLDAEPVYFRPNAQRLELEPHQQGEEGGAVTEVTFRPRLDSGSHVLEVIARDATGNPVYARAEFKVETQFTLLNVLNYPNPFSDRTAFTYVLTQPADRVRLQVFTLSGRKIFQTETLPAEVGFNSFTWDGHDADGDPLANGVYLYRLTAVAGGKRVSVLSKLIVMR